MKFFDLTEQDIPKPLQPQFILDVETQELFIQAGLQDRVIQIYEGMVYMDFNQAVMESQGYGAYVMMDYSSLPQLWLAYLSDPSDSGKIHSNVKQRWLQGDKEVVEGMKKFGELTDEAKEAIEQKDHQKLASLMDQNFELRRKIYTDRALGEQNLKMIEIAKKYGSSAKFCGSGGAIVGLCLDEDKKFEMMQEFRSEGFVFCNIQPLNFY
jgi:glucuronokinase